MSVYEFIGVLRCPYRDNCGPDSEQTAFEFRDEDTDAFEDVCYTRRHRECDQFKMKRAQEQRTKPRLDKRAFRLLLRCFTGYRVD
ncbi:MAG: hypothetical protein ABIG30_02870 [Candidatus Aenigmatarchaeota archaeon]